MIGLGVYVGIVVFFILDSIFKILPSGGYYDLHSLNYVIPAFPWVWVLYLFLKRYSDYALIPIAMLIASYILNALIFSLAGFLFEKKFRPRIFFRNPVAIGVIACSIALIIFYSVMNDGCSQSDCAIRSGFPWSASYKQIPYGQWTGSDWKILKRYSVINGFIIGAVSFGLAYMYQRRRNMKRNLILKKAI